MEHLNLTNIIMGILLTATAWFLKDALVTLRAVEKEQGLHAIKLATHEVRITDLEESR